jgi:hypothetical protein
MVGRKRLFRRRLRLDEELLPRWLVFLLLDERLDGMMHFLPVDSRLEIGQMFLFQ